jgi:hypothetical protein
MYQPKSVISAKEVPLFGVYLKFYGRRRKILGKRQLF